MSYANSNLRPDELLAELRKSPRYLLSASVDVTLNGARHGSGSVIDISIDGCGFKCYTDLFVGQDYQFTISQVGVFTGTIMRRYKSHCYGAKFTLDPLARKALGARLASMGKLAPTYTE